MMVVADAPTGAAEGAIPNMEGGLDAASPLPFPMVLPAPVEAPEPHPMLMRTAKVLREKPREKRVERIMFGRAGSSGGLV